MRKTVLAAATVLLLLTAGCGSTTGGGGGDGGFAKKDPVKIGYSTYDLQNPYWQNYTAGIKAAAKAMGIQVVVADQKNSAQAQVFTSFDLVNQKISGLIVSPVEPKALPASVSAAHAAKIPLVVGDVGAAGSYDALIVSDNTKGGADAADFMAAQLAAKGAGPKNVGVVTLHPGSAVGVDRVKGFKDRLTAKYPNIKIVSELNGNDNIKEGHDAVVNMLAANPDLAGVYAANDNEAQGAIAAFQEAGRKPADAVIIGFDGNALSIKAVEEGTQAASVAQDPYGQGQLAVKLVMQLLDGKKPAYSDPKTKTVLFPITLVTKDNVKQFSTDRAGQS